MPYQVDFLPVGEGERSGDAIALRFGDLSDPAKQQVIVIDGGFQASGEALVEHIKTFYGTSYVDVVVSTHPDNDHSSGLSVVLEKLTVGQLWMHKPWEHTDEVAKMFTDGRVTDMSVAEGIRKSLDNARYLETVAAKRKVNIVEPFAGVKDNTGSVVVLGPTQSFYEGLLPDFRCTPEPKYTSVLGKLAYGAASVVTKVAEAIGIETLQEPEGTHAENNSSAIICVVTDDTYLLFLADAGVPALHEVVTRLEAAQVDMNKFSVIQVPHHGSRRNVGPSILDRLLGPKTATFETKRRAVVSAAPDGAPKHPSKQVMNAFRRRGAPVWGTMEGKALMFNSGAPRPGWTSADPLPFYSEVDD